MQDVITFLTDVSTLSSSGLFGAIFDFLGQAGSWAEAVSKLIGLAG